MVLLAVFVFYQSRNKNEPLLPLELFKDRNFSLANVAITAMGFAITSMVLPLMFYTQAVRGLSPTQSALLLVPMAVLTGIFAPIIGKLVDKTHPRYIAGTGFLLFAIALGWLALVMSPDVAIWELLLPIGLIGFANACIWSPLAATATHNLPPMQAGAGGGRLQHHPAGGCGSRQCRDRSTDHRTIGGTGSDRRQFRSRSGSPTRVRP